MSEMDEHPVDLILAPLGFEAKKFCVTTRCYQVMYKDRRVKIELRERTFRAPLDVVYRTLKINMGFRIYVDAPDLKTYAMFGNRIAWRRWGRHWDNQIELDIPEFTCICPKTGLPDFATIKVAYCPAKTCIELKSFKLYIVAYRNLGIFHEHLTNRILDDVVKACKPRKAKVEAIMNPRGGIATKVVAEYFAKTKK